MGSSLDACHAHRKEEQDPFDFIHGRGMLLALGLSQFVQNSKFARRRRYSF